MNARDIESLSAFYVANRQQLYTYAVSITGNREAAEDAIQGVFEKLLRGRSLPANLRPYVFRSLRNAALDGWRRAKVRSDSMFDVAEAAGTAARDPTHAGANADDFEPLLAQLTPDEREAVVLRTYSGLAFQEIAALRSVPLPTAASWYRRGLARLREMLKKEI